MMSGGKLYAVTRAVKWLRINYADGSEYSHSSYIQDEILITFGSKSIQVKSPDLFDFLTEITYVNARNGG
ncbi:hypothetical protein PghCCS26_14720 [Paenibacillus glycanilyticus]|uniref:Uncharacterized protein n=1 Tax=Paenibacillus glycanilyticus TaxID=126569 RepID=A0ABQ6NIN6_9BACL|nr:hypothetical protein PghCCS26_14720 [Paenibacillus glycanilyticus]